MAVLDPIIVNNSKELSVRDFNKNEIEQIVKEFYFNNFGLSRPLVKIGDEYSTIEKAIAYLKNLTVEEIEDGTKSYVDIVNLIPGVSARLRAVAKNHYDLANGNGKASVVIFCETIFNEYTYLGLPPVGKGDSQYLSNEGGYPTAQGLHEQLDALYDKLPNALKEAIKLVEIPCYIPRYQISDAKYICKLFVPSATELGVGHDDENYGTNIPENGDGSKYDYFDSGNGEVACNKRKTKFINGDDGYFWTRTPFLSYASCWFSVDTGGRVDVGGPNVSCGLPLAFCI